MKHHIYHTSRTNDFSAVPGVLIAILHDDFTIKTSLKILLFNARDNVRMAGTKQRKFTENWKSFQTP